MRRRLKEETIIFISVFKWLVLATIVGIIVGISTTVFVKALNWGASLGHYNKYSFVLMPIGLLLSVLVVKYLAPETKGHGANKVIESVHKYSGKIKAVFVPVEFFT